MFKIGLRRRLRTTAWIAMCIIFVIVDCGNRLSAGRADQEAGRPNVVFILADDMGFGDVRTNNSESSIPTPFLDRMAAEGMRFTDGHSPSGVCTPTRYGILTGRYCWRTRLKRGVLWGIDRALMDPDRMTLAKVFRDKGYTTACIGKWHLGMDIRDTRGKLLEHSKRFESVAGSANIDYEQHIGRSPLEYGFDESYVIIGSLNMYPYTYVNGNRFVRAATEFQPRTEHAISIVSGGPKSPHFDFEAVMDVFTDKAVSFVRRSARKQQPFFLYFPLSAPHKPVLPTAIFQGKSGRGIYGDFVMQVDATVGAIDKVLLETGVKENTLVVFTSDNGSFMYRFADSTTDHVEDFRALGYQPKNHQSNYIWRGTKADIYEGGHRVPLIVRWPNVIEAGSTCEQAITLTDWYATFAEIVSHPLLEDEAEDSHSLLALLKRDSNWRRPPIIHHSSGGMFAIRDGHWKLIAGNGSGGRQSPKGTNFARPYQLYDLAVDPSEKNNLIDARPEIAAKLEKSLDEIRRNGRSRIHGIE